MHFEYVSHHGQKTPHPSKRSVPFYVQLLNSLRFPNTMPVHRNSHHHTGTTHYLLSLHALLKIAALLFMLLVAALSYFFHIDSPWVKDNLWSRCIMAKETKRDLKWTDDGLNYTMKIKSCPSIAHERFLVYNCWFVIIASLIDLIGCCVANIETVNALRKQNAFLNIAFSIVIFTGGVLYVVSPLTLEASTCTEVKDAETGTSLQVEKGKLKSLCSLYLYNSNKIAAGALALAAGIMYGALACYLENSKLFGMDSGVVPQAQNHRSSTEVEEGPPPRQSIIRRRRSSVSTRSVKKGVGSFGAVTSNIGKKNDTASAAQRSSSSPSH